MGLPKRNVSISFNKGIDTKTDNKQDVTGQLVVLENGVLQTQNEIRKRDGYQSFPQTTSVLTTLGNSIVPPQIGCGNFIANFNDETVLNDGFNLYSRSASSNNWVYKGNSPQCKLDTSYIVRNAYNQTMQDSASNANAQIFAWEDSSTGGVVLSIIDTVTGQVMLANYSVSSTGISPRCIVAGGRLYCIYYDTNDTLIHYIYWDGQSISGIGTAISNINTTHPNFDAISGFGNTIYIAYNGASSTIKVAIFDQFMNAGTVLTENEVATNCITIFSGASSDIFVAYNNSTATKIFIVDYLLTTTILAPTVVQTISNVKNITGYSLDDVITLFYDVLGSAVNSSYINSVITYNTVTIAGVVGTPATFMRSASLQSKAFIVTNYNNNNLANEIIHVTVVHDANLQPTYFVAALYNTTPFANFTIVAKICPSSAGSVPVRSQLCSVQASLSGQNVGGLYKYSMPLLNKDQLFIQSTSTGNVATFTETGVISASLDFTYGKNVVWNEGSTRPVHVNSPNNNPPSCLQLGNNLHFGGGYLQMYDGVAVCEHGFHLYPDSSEITYSGSTTGGNLANGSSYGVAVVYEWVDNQGQTHRSSPSPAYSVVLSSTGSTGKISLTIPTLRITAKANVNIVIYRTGSNGSVYYRDNQPNAPLANDLSSDTVSYDITQADSDVLANEQLYTTGGEVPNIAAPAANIMCISQNRIILIPSENTFSWWFSKEVIPGSPIEFSNEFVENIDDVGGGISACAQMDSNLILFTGTKIYPIGGEGPSPSGANNDFTNPVAIATDTGCLNQASVVLTQDGLMYQSPKGLYLLSRSLQNSYIGSDVEDFNSLVVMSSGLIESLNQVRFALTSGDVLVYDYFYRQWYTFTDYGAVSSINNLGLYTFVTSNGLLCQETPGVYNDNGQMIKLRVVMSWLSFAGIQGFKRLYEMIILGTYKGPHTLLVKVAYNFNNFFTQQCYVNATALTDQNIYGEDPIYGSSSPFGGTYVPYQWRFFFDQQKCQSVQISIEDNQTPGEFTNSQGFTTTTTYNEGLSLANIALRFGVKEGLNKLPASSSFG